ncbi:MAG: hypothetical protein KGL39_10810 [Patescibacteria group bacterium]|nr:hypothetical protein [Patescibacteria group bacterium]
MQDIFGHTVAPVAAKYRPRNGAWVIVQLKDKGKQAELAGLAGWCAGDAGLCCLFQDQHVTTPLKGVSGGQPFEEPAQLVGPRLYLVKQSGHNLSRLVWDDKEKNDKQTHVFLHLDSPLVESLRPVATLADLPPGRAVDLPWVEKFTGRQLPAEVHERARADGDRMTVADVIEVLKKAG